MNSSEFRQVAVVAAEKYFNYLASSQKHHSQSSAGLSRISVYSMTRAGGLRNTYLCSVSGKIKSPDSCFVVFRNVPCDDIEILRYSNRERKVVLRLPDRILSAVPTFSPDDFVIASDLKFLIRRLGNFYHKNTISFSPPAPSPLPPHEYSCSISPDEFQAAAIDGIFTSPVSYVWGPPGTGKTQCVLAECLLRYISAKKRVLLLAPTNNAVEQMLRGLLPLLRQAKIDLTLVSRIGTASAAFAKEYPEVVIDSELERELFELQERKKDLLQELENAEHFWKEYDRKVKAIDALSDFAPKIEQWADLQERINDSSKQLLSIEKDIISSSDQLVSLRKIIGDLNAHLLNCNNSIASAPSRFRSLFMTKKQKSQVADSLIKWLDAKERLTTEISKSDETYSAISHELFKLRSERSSLEKRIASLRNEQYLLFRELPSFGPFSDRAISFLDGLDAVSPQESLRLYHELISQCRESVKEQPQFRTSDEICAAIDACNIEIESIQSCEKVSQRLRALVVASTSDAIIPYLPATGSEEFHHVFLDEAGYTSLMRGLVAFSCRCPVTFLGDHYQLSPICEMPRIEVDDMEVSLFSLPCAYFSELISYDIFHMHELYCKAFRDPKKSSTLPEFEHMPMFPLMRSYRFGKELAGILSKHIYPFPFSGDSKDGFRIIVFDAPNPYFTAGARESIPEVEAIRHFLSEHTVSPDHYAVFSPYRSQCKLLQTALQSFASNVLTVHRAQGMEFDFIILSVTDRNNKFMVDTNLSVGRRTMNTAISRAKKGIILVCDRAYWEQLQGQLISDLIKLESHTYEPHLLLDAITKKED